MSQRASWPELPRVITQPMFFDGDWKVRRFGEPDAIAGERAATAVADRAMAKSLERFMAAILRHRRTACQPGGAVWAAACDSSTSVIRRPPRPRVKKLNDQRMTTSKRFW